jgi:hypothetical protein
MNELKLELIESDDITCFDFIVDGKSLHSLLYPEEANYPQPQAPPVSCLNAMYQDEELQKALDSLLLRRRADFPDNRRALYVCPMCGDLGCGVETAVIEEGENTITWRNFGRENTYEDNVDRHEEVGPFVFDKAQYVATWKDLLALLT